VADYRILVTGSRDWHAAGTLGRELAEAVRSSGHHPSEVVIVHGDAQGADKMADHWAQRYGLRVERYPARWGAPCRPDCRIGHRQTRDGSGYCPAAGMYRNAEMLATGIRLVAAFLMPCSKSTCRDPRPHFSHGAFGCVTLAGEAGIPVKPVGALALEGVDVP
jgi:hypothetical protein